MTAEEAVKQKWPSARAVPSADNLHPAEVSQLERTNAALLGALKEAVDWLEYSTPEENQAAQLQSAFVKRARTALAEAESQKENGNG